MRNFVQEGRTISVVAAAAVDSGDPVLIGALFGVAASDAEIGDSLDINTEGVFTLPKVSTDAFTVGAKVYWDNSAKLVTVTSSGNTLIGAAVSAAGNPSSFVNVRLNGSF